MLTHTRHQTATLVLKTRRKSVTFTPKNKQKQVREDDEKKKVGEGNVSNIKDIPPSCIKLITKRSPDAF